MFNTEHASPELFASLTAAQSEIENATKNANNPFHKSKYADLNEVLSVVKPVFVKHKLFFAQLPSFDGALASITTLISNDKGAYISGTSSCTPAKSDAQGIGSASTYLRRYALAGIAGIYQEDDDGESAKHDRKPAPVAQKPAPAPTPPNPNLEKIKENRSKLIAEVLEYGLDIGDTAKAQTDWYNNIAKDIANKAGKKAADMDAHELDMFFAAIADAALEQVQKAGITVNA